FLRYPSLVQSVRQGLRLRTAFNLIGPWCNPARVQRQVIGVSDERYVTVFASVAQALRSDCVLVVHGRDGHIDEFSPSGVSVIAEVRAEHTRTYEVQLGDFGLQSAPLDQVSG